QQTGKLRSPDKHRRMASPASKYWEIKAGWSWGCVAAIDSNRRTIWIADAHCDDGKRFVVHTDEKLTAFVELELAIRGGSRLAASHGYVFGAASSRARFMTFCELATRLRRGIRIPTIS